MTGSVSTTLGGVPRVWRGPSIAWTATNGGTRTSTERPGAWAARISASVRTVEGQRRAVQRDGVAVGQRAGQVVAVHDQVDDPGDEPVARGDRAARAVQRRCAGPGDARAGDRRRADRAIRSAGRLARLSTACGVAAAASAAAVIGRTYVGDRRAGAAARGCASPWRQPVPAPARRGRPACRRSQPGSDGRLGRSRPRAAVEPVGDRDRLGRRTPRGRQRADHRSKRRRQRRRPGRAQLAQRDRNWPCDVELGSRARRRRRCRVQRQRRAPRTGR